MDDCMVNGLVVMYLCSVTPFEIQTLFILMLPGINTLHQYCPPDYHTSLQS